MLARVLRNGKVEAEIPLPFAGETSTYAGTLTLSGSGPVDVLVLALDPANANFGWARQEFELTH